MLMEKQLRSDKSECEIVNGEHSQMKMQYLSFA